MSYGAGRYDPAYEERGGRQRLSVWLCALDGKTETSGLSRSHRERRMVLDRLITHRFRIEERNVLTTYCR